MVTESEYTPKFPEVLDRFIKRIGEITAWINVVLIAVIILQVVLRYVFSSGLVILEELQWHLYAVGIMVGLSYCTIRDTHIRLDLMHERFSQRRKSTIEIFGTLFLLMPMVIVILIHSWPFVLQSFTQMEGSDAGGTGLPYRWIVKSCVLICFGFLGGAGMSRLIRAAAFLKSDPR